MSQQSCSRTLDKYVLRLPDGLRDQIKADAKANGRSMNAEIVARLEGSAKTLRDEIAIAAIPAIITGLYMVSVRGGLEYENDYAAAASAAYEMADAFMTARSGASS